MIKRAITNGYILLSKLCHRTMLRPAQGEKGHCEDVRTPGRTAAAVYWSHANGVQGTFVVLKGEPKEYYMQSFQMDKTTIYSDVPVKGVQ